MLKWFKGVLIAALTNVFVKIFPIGNGSFLTLGKWYWTRKEGTWMSQYVVDIKEVDRIVKEYIVTQEANKPKRRIF